MTDIGEWIGLIATGFIIGGFLGFVISRADVIAGVLGAVAVILALVLYRLVIVDRFIEVHQL